MFIDRVKIDSSELATIKEIQLDEHITVIFSGTPDLIVDANGHIINIETLLLNLIYKVAQREKYYPLIIPDSILIIPDSILEDYFFRMENDKEQQLILIDKIESHCHPSLHRYLIPNLLKKYPGVQFIVTTWSPLVLSSVRNECIRHIYEREIYQATCYGHDSNLIYARYFNVKDFPDFVEEKLKNFSKAIDMDDRETALTTFRELKTTLGNHPEIIYLQNLLDFEFNINADELIQ